MIHNLDSVENNLRHSAKGSLDAYDVTFSLTCTTLLQHSLQWVGGAGSEPAGKRRGYNELSALVAAAYTSHSFDVVEVLDDLLDKAQTQLHGIRHAVTKTAHSFAMLKPFLVDQLAQLNKYFKKADVAEFHDVVGCREAELAVAEKSFCSCGGGVEGVADATQVLQAKMCGAER